MKTTICDLTANHAHMNDRVVRVRATLHSSRHVTYLSDRRCPRPVLDWFESERFRKSESWNEFLDAVWAQERTDFELRPLDAGKDFRVEVTGRFVWGPPKQGSMWPDAPGRIIVSELHSFEATDHEYANELERLRDRCELRAYLGRELDVARTACDAAFQHSNGAAQDRFHRGLVALRENRHAEALADFDALVERSPREPWYLYGRGLARIRNGRDAEGRADILRAVELDPPNIQESDAPLPFHGLSP